MLELLLGDEAVALGALDAGISGAFSYPGTPATEILEFIQQRTRGVDGLSARWSANEKVALEEALGMSFAGKRALVSMKHVGLNVAADPFMNAALTGAHGGLVIVVADDPGMHSSQNEQDTRYYGDFAKVLMFEPSNQQECYDMTREAFEMSERIGLPVLVRLVTRLAHSRANVLRSAPAQVDRGVRLANRPQDWTLLPVNARRRFRRLIDLQSALREYSEHARYNKLELRGPHGILAAGLAHNYVREVIGSDSSYSLLKIGTYPLPVPLIRELIDHCSDVLVAEDGYPFIESHLCGLLGVPGRAIRGKRDGAFPPDGELSVDRVRAALGMPATTTPPKVEDLPGRPPRLCDGCPHCDTFSALLEATEGMDRVLFSDIGCYTLGALPPYNAVQSCVDMGASVSMALGAAKAGAHPVLCTIGDSTFCHSGMTPLLGAAHEDANMTVVILDNATVGMTGGQEVFVTGDAFVDLLKGLGVREDQIVRIEPVKKQHQRNVELVRKAIEHRGLSVILACRPCVQVSRKATKKLTEKEQASGAPA
ncbi:MAG TPA: thiamine pyrophosphate-dependent enzyme [Phycisphaerae bacterium]|nr:thiamine pyrophosphate-dependent enzyme [Phycisphaerae bacterium]HNU44619.1 thiamine pyrophosphate-dependent enzyme [Phycisphaerae bacterium]